MRARRERASAGAVTIEIADVTHRFAGSKQTVEVLSSVSLGIRAGEFITIVGPSGCGKTTLLNLVSGLVGPSEGAVLVDGRQLDGAYTDLGFVFQQPNLLEWRTALRNIMLQAEARKLDRTRAQTRARELMATTGLAGFEDSYPSQLSGGMRQRVSICRALLHDPPLLLMDEPFGALDALTREQMTADLEALWIANPKTVLFVTHDIREAVLLGDRVVVMSARPGEILRTIEIDVERPRAEAADVERLTTIEKEVRDLFRMHGVLQTGRSASLVTEPAPHE